MAPGQYVLWQLDRVHTDSGDMGSKASSPACEAALPHPLGWERQAGWSSSSLHLRLSDASLPRPRSSCASAAQPDANLCTGPGCLRAMLSNVAASPCLPVVGLTSGIQIPRVISAAAWLDAEITGLPCSLEHQCCLIGTAAYCSCTVPKHKIVRRDARAELGLCLVLSETII